MEDTNVKSGEPPTHLSNPGGAYEKSAIQEVRSGRSHSHNVKPGSSGRKSKKTSAKEREEDNSAATQNVLMLLQAIKSGKTF